MKYKQMKMFNSSDMPEELKSNFIKIYNRKEDFFEQYFDWDISDYSDICKDINEFIEISSKAELSEKEAVEVEVEKQFLKSIQDIQAINNWLIENGAEKDELVIIKRNI